MNLKKNNIPQHFRTRVIQLQMFALILKSSAGAKCCFMGEIWARNDNFEVFFTTKKFCYYKSVFGFLKAVLVHSLLIGFG